MNLTLFFSLVIDLQHGPFLLYISFVLIGFLFSLFLELQCFLTSTSVLSFTLVFFFVDFQVQRHHNVFPFHHCLPFCSFPAVTFHRENGSESFGPGIELEVPL